MSLDKIKASVDTVMTEELVRLFRFAGCHPTLCHACGKRITAGRVFRLVPHKKAPDLPLTDEMCCASCGEAELDLRDGRELSASVRRHTLRSGQASWGGYSRPSIEQPQGSAAHSSGEGTSRSANCVRELTTGD